MVYLEQDVLKKYGIHYGAQNQLLFANQDALRLLFDAFQARS